MFRGLQNNTMHVQNHRSATQAGMGPGGRVWYATWRGARRERGQGRPSQERGQERNGMGGAWKGGAGRGGKEGGAEKGDRNERIAFSQKLKKGKTT